MCGIAGFIGRGSQEIGQSMIQTIKHRGPDHQGVYFKDNVCLAHARLSILDVSSGSHQPMFNTDNSIGLIFNGEIYNYLILKDKLLKTGKYNFRTTSDTEVVLYLYQEYDLEFLDMIHGMFAIAIYDYRSMTLIAARDRMGKKPFYYTEIDDTFIFGSEIKAVTKHPLVKKELDLDAINQYLTFDYIPTPASLYKNIYKLEPAHYLIVKNGKIETKKRYWNYDFTTNHSLDFNAAKSQLDCLLNQATASRLMSDVPLGVFLSGGLDSSTVAYYAQLNSSQKIKTFSIGFEDKSYDEQDYALQVANHLGTEHYMSVLTPTKTIELIEEIFPLMDEPCADASIIPTYYLSQFTRQHVTVALGGDGSDELLAGYPTFISENYKFVNSILPSSLNKFILQVVNTIMKPSDDNISLDFKIKQYLRGFSSENHHIHQLWLGSFLPSEKIKLFKPEILDNLSNQTGLDIINYHYNEAKKLNIDDWHQIIYSYCNTYLVDDILFKVDRASMYNSLEVRAPFLDRSVVEFVNKLPKEYKIKGNNGKYILKELMRDKLPNNIIDRPKKGFGIPLSNWIKKDLKSEIESVILSPDNLFNASYIRSLLVEHISGKANHRKLIWNLYCLKKGDFLN
jgi:asparagine synthase (glutamine-hydrolysing)